MKFFATSFSLIQWPGSIKINVFRNKSCTVHYTINVISKAGVDVVNPLLTKLFRSRWLDIGLVFFGVFMDLDLANIQPS